MGVACKLQAAGGLVSLSLLSKPHLICAWQRPVRLTAFGEKWMRAHKVAVEVLDLVMTAVVCASYGPSGLKQTSTSFKMHFGDTSTPSNDLASNSTSLLIWHEVI